uniref:Bm10957 n=1 Tax=Brugia malayi TaxID=6279 RepID=A0A0H5SD10_BRUMA|nr:Bm10957 [Brugia malayi]
MKLLQKNKLLNKACHVSVIHKIQDESSGVNFKLKRQVTRAKLVHRSTLALYDKHLNAFYGCMESHLFDRALIINLVKRNEVNGLPYENIRCDYVPCIAYIYPERNNQHMNEGHSSRSDCPDLFIPDFTRAKVFRESDRWPGNEEFTLTLTDESGKRTFAYCVRHLIRRHELNNEQATSSKEGDLPEVFAIISPIHAPLFYFALARECVCYLHDNLKKLENLLNVVYRCTFPTDGSSLHVFEKAKDGFKRNIVIRGQGPTLGQSDCSGIVRRMGPEITVAIIAALLAEQRVIIAGGSVQCVCHAVQSVACLLHPFSWPYTLIPVLPDSLLEIVNSPTPYLMGLLRTNMYKLKSLAAKDKNQCTDDLTQDDLVIVDLDGGIFVPQLTELYTASESIDYKAKNAFALCEKLLVPRKLAVSLAIKLKEAIAVGEGPRADLLLQKAMLSWFAALIWPYKGCGFYAAFVAESNGDFESIRTSKAQLIASHSSKSARRFTEWFVETGIFREWIRRKVASAPEITSMIPDVAEDVVNQKFDEYVIAATLQSSQRRVTNIFTKAHNVVFRSYLAKKL